MKREKLFFGRSLLTMFTAVLVLSGCVKEQMDVDPTWQSDEVLFSIQVPGSSAPATRAIGEDSADDNAIKEVDIMLFDSNDKYVRSVYCENIENTAQMNIKIVKGRLPEGTYKIVVLANVHDKILANPITVGTLRANAFDNIRFALTTFGDKWNSIPGSTNYRDFPMWGEAAVMTTIPRANANDVVDVTLARMLSKINVSMVYTETSGVKDFELKSIEVFNYNTQGRLVPNLINWAASPKVATEVKTRETGATPTSLKFDNTGGHNYILTNAASKTFTCIDEIFVFESAGVSPGTWNWADNTCVVIGGEYKGQMGYYRLDFLANNVNIDIIRNYKYSFEIEAIKNQGYIDAYEALKNFPENLEYTVVPWDENKIGDLIVEGAIQLSISPKSTITFHKDPDTQGVDIYTNWSKGWQVERKNYSGTEKYRIEDSAGDHLTWITLDNYGTTAPGEKTLKITVAANDSGADRTGYVYITTKSGRLQHRLTVVQNNKTKNMLVITDGNDLPITEMIFAAAADVAPAEQTFKVKWAPTSQILYSSAESVTNPKGGYFPLPSWGQYLASSKDGIINLNSAPNIYVADVNNTSGEMIFKIQPTAISAAVMGGDPFYERQVEVKYRISTPQGLLRQNVAIQQFVRNMRSTVEGFHLADGSSYTFNVKSNVPWKAYLINDGGGIVTKPAVNVSTPFATGGYNLPEGTNVSFTTENDLADPKIIFGAAKVKIEWLSGDDPANPAHWTTEPNLELQCSSGVLQPLSNSYIVAPNSLPILIPVKRANGYGIDKNGIEYRQAGWSLGDQLTGAYTAELVWTDTPHIKFPTTSIGEKGVVKMIIVGGSDENGYVLVIPGAGEGNAVVSASVGGNIVWSWHIWAVANYNPTPTDNNGWMDRNLGATTNTVNKVSSLGNFYQWGSKDPIQGSNSLTPTPSHMTTTPPRYIYLGNNTMEATIKHVSNITLIESIQNPKGLRSSGWVGSNGDDSWVTNYNNVAGTGDKTIYDPCPHGWQVPVRKDVAWDDPNNNRSWGANIDHTIKITDAEMATHMMTLGAYNFYWPNRGGNYPLPGCVRVDVGALNIYNPGGEGNYWTGNRRPHASLTNAYVMMFRYSTTGSVVYPYYYYRLHSGNPVRCVTQ